MPTIEPSSVQLTASASTPSLPPGVPLLHTLYLYIAGECNLACKHCWISPTYVSNNQGGQYLSLDHALKVIQEAKPLGLSSVKLTGGEPTLHPQFRDLVQIIHDQGLGITMETNGTLIDPSLAQFIKGHGFTFISVSLDGANSQTHEEMRSVRGSFDRAVNGIKALVEVGFPVQVICTLHRGNIAEMEDVLSLASDLGCGSVKFNIAQRAGRGERFVNDHGLDIHEILEANQRVEKELAQKYDLSVFIDVPPAFQSISTMLNQQSRCGITSILGVLSGGEIALCGIGVTLPELIYGHVMSDDLRTIWCEHPNLVELRRLIPAQLEGICQQCVHLSFCRGHCVANNYYTSKKLNAPFRFCQEASQLGLFPVSRRLVSDFEQ